MTSLWEILPSFLVLAGLMLLVIPLFRGRRIVGTATLRRAGMDREISTRYHNYAFIVLGLLALGDAAQTYSSIFGGTPGVVGAFFGAATGLVGQRHVDRWVFLPLGLLAVGSSVTQFVSGTAADSGFALTVLALMGGGVVLGIVPFGEARPTVVLAKCCAAVVLTDFAVSPLGAAVVGPDLDPVRVLGTFVVAFLAGILLILPGGLVAVLLGIGVGLLSFYWGLRTVGPATDFTVAFLLMWAIAAFLRSRIGARSRS